MPKSPKTVSTLPVREYIEVVQLLRTLNMDILSIYTSTRADSHNASAPTAFTDSLVTSAKSLAKRLEGLLDT